MNSPVYCYGPARADAMAHVAKRLTLVSFRGDALRPFLKARICDKCIADMKAAGLEFGNPAVTVSDEAARMIQAQADTSFECGEWTNDLDDDYDKVLADSMKADADLTAYVAKLEDSLEALTEQKVQPCAAGWFAEGCYTGRLDVADRPVFTIFPTAQEAIDAYLAASRSTTEPEATS